MTNPDEPTQPIPGGPSAPEPTRVLPPDGNPWPAAAARPSSPEPTRVLPTHGDLWAPPGSPEPTRVLPDSGDPRPAAAPPSTWPPPSPEQRWEPPSYQPRYGTGPGFVPPQYDPYGWTGAQPGQQPAGAPPAYPQPYGPPQQHAQQCAPPQQYGYQAPHHLAGPPQYPGQPPSTPPGQPPYDPNLPWWHPSQPQHSQAPHGHQPQPYQTEPPRKRTTLQRVSLVVAVVLAFAMALGGLSYLFPGATERAGESVQTPVPSESQAAPTEPASADPDQPRAQPALGVTAAESAGVVLIEAGTTGGLASGTGMVVTRDGKVLTNYHVVAGSDSIDVTIADTGRTHEATMLGFDQTRDIALLQLSEAMGLTTVTLDTDSVERGDPAYAVGNADGGGELVRAAGEVTDLDEDLTVTSDSPWGSEEDLEGLIETSAGAVPGHSGGPMFDAEAEVMGMTTAGSPERGTSYAIPIAEAMSVVAVIEAGQDSGTVRVGPAGYLGVKVGDTNRVGATVTEVVAGSPAEAVGIEAGAMLTRVGQTRITPDTNLANAIRSLEPGQQVLVEWVAPDGSPREATVVLGSSPVN